MSSQHPKHDSRLPRGAQSALQSSSPLTSDSAPPARSAPALRSFNRRDFMQAAGLGAAAALIGCKSGESSAVAATSSPAAGTSTGASSSAPETPDLRFGMIALTDCSPIVIAHERGLFKKYGINSTVIKGASWAAIRDSLSNGDIQATHMLIGMPIASTMGLLGAPKKPMVIPWMLNRNGQAITLQNKYKGRVAADPKALAPLVNAAKAAGTPLTFAMTFPPGTHAMWMRYYLAAGGINPDKDVALVTVPPAQMVANMKVDKMDGFCVGEPWGARAIADDIGYTAITTQEIWEDHPEKVCAFTEEFAEKNPKTVKAVLKALYEASVWLDDLKNRAEQAAIVSRPTYINCAPELILPRLLGDYDYGDGRKKKDERYMSFHARNCNYPQPKYATWWLTQFRRWGMVDANPDYAGVAAKVMRGDLYQAALRELGVEAGVVDDSPVKLFDGVTFDPKSPEAYATSFAVHSMKA
jgi:nitrate/nitrite transport system substrate-binding protein